MNSNFASTSNLNSSSNALNSNNLIDLHSENGIKELELKILNLISNFKFGEKILIILDSINKLSEFGIHNVFSLLKKTLNELKSFPGKFNSIELSR